MQQLNEAVQEMGDSTMQNARHAENSTDAAHGLQAQAEELSRTLKKLEVLNGGRKIAKTKPAAKRSTDVQPVVEQPKTSPTRPPD